MKLTYQHILRHFKVPPVAYDNIVAINRVLQSLKETKMAIPPSPGRYTKEELQLEIDEAKAMIQKVESKLAAMKDTVEAVGEVAAKKVKAEDKPSYGMKK